MKARQRGFYCPDCGTRQSLPSGACNCIKCGALGLRGHNTVPRRVSCRHCAFTGWDDGGVNDDLPRHYTTAHGEDRERIRSLEALLRYSISARTCTCIAFESPSEPCHGTCWPARARRLLGEAPA